MSWETDLVKETFWKTMKEQYEKMTPREKKKFLKHLFKEKEAKPE